MARKILRRLKFDNQTIKQVTTLVRWHDRRFASIEEVNKKTVRRWVSQLTPELFTRLMEVQKADISAQSDYQRDKKEQVLQETKKLFEEIIEEKNCLSIKELKINGKDLMDMGVPQGKEIGQILSWLLDQVLEDPQLNECETLTRMAERKEGCEMILLWIPVLIFAYIKMIDPGKKRKHPVLNVKYYAHRGFHGEEGIPENSMAAFKKAKGAGYGIELDVQLTKDGVMVVHHDYDLKRTCGVNKKITDLTYRELCRYRLMGTRERIPRFVEVLREVDGKVPLLVELKMETCNRKLCKKVAKALDQYKGLYCMECFHPYALYWFKKNRPEVIRGQLSEQFLKEKEEGTFTRKIGYFIVKNLLTNFITKPDFYSLSL